jgi:hypothetical protein
MTPRPASSRQSQCSKIRVQHERDMALPQRHEFRSEVSCGAGGGAGAGAAAAAKIHIFFVRVVHVLSARVAHQSEVQRVE